MKHAGPALVDSLHEAVRSLVRGRRPEMRRQP